LEDVLANQPTLIITPPGESIDKKRFPVSSPRVDALFEAIFSRYPYKTSIGQWDMYTLAPTKPGCAPP
jgi:hypothetical protein